MGLPPQSGLLLLAETCYTSSQGNSKLPETASQGSILQGNRLKQAESVPNDREKALGLSKDTGVRNCTPTYLRGHPIYETESGVW